MPLRHFVYAIVKSIKPINKIIFSFLSVAWIYFSDLLNNCNCQTIVVVTRQVKIKNNSFEVIQANQKNH